MSISAIGGCSAAQTQATQYRGTSATSAAGGSAKPDPGGFISAIASALSEIGATSAASDATSATATATATEPAKALGDFLNSLMEALHAQGGGKDVAGADGADAPPPPPPDGKGGGIATDLQSLIASLAGTGDSSTGTSLATSFKSLLGALGADSGDATSRLSQFLQTLSDKLSSSGPAGNLINTTA